MQEALSRAFIHAIGGRAGVIVRIGERAFDYGIDGSLHEVKFREGGGKVESGFAVDFQLKSTTNWQIDNDHIVYDLEVHTYNDLVGRDPDATTCFLILLCLPPEQAEWLSASENRLRLSKSCYWIRLDGERSDNARTHRIRIPRANLLTTDSIGTLLRLEREKRRGGDE